MESSETPLVSIVVISYNQAEFLEDTLLSVSGQTYPNIEAIVVDNASSDNSLDLIRRWMDEAKLPVRLIENDSNLGLCGALNQGLEVIRGKYYHCVAGDDILLPEKIEKQVAVLEARPEVAVVYSDAETIDREGRVTAESILDHDLPSGRVFDALLDRNFIPGPAFLMQTDIIRSLGGYDSTLFYEDWDLYLRVAEKHEFQGIDEPLIQYRRLEKSMIRNPDHINAINYSTVKSQLRYIDRSPQARELILKRLIATSARFYMQGDPRTGELMAIRKKHDSSWNTRLIYWCHRLGLPYQRAANIRSFLLNIRMRFRGTSSNATMN